jgi:hypothetical protein
MSDESIARLRTFAVKHTNKVPLIKNEGHLYFY